MILYMPLGTDKYKALAIVAARAKFEDLAKHLFYGMMMMAKSADHSDNVTKLDKPVLSLKAPSRPTANPRPPGRPLQVATSRDISECHILISGPGPGRLPSVAVAADLGGSLLSCLFEQPTHYLSGPYAKLGSPTYTGLI